MSTDSLLIPISNTFVEPFAKSKGIEFPSSSSSPLKATTGSECKAEFKTVILSRLMFDLGEESSGPNTSESTVEISLDNLWDIRSGLVKCRSNLRIENTVDVAHELLACPGIENSIIIDLTTPQENRDLSRLMRLKLDTKLSIGFSTGNSPDSHDSNDRSSQTPTSTVSAMEVELLIGRETPKPESFLLRPAAISCPIRPVSACERGILSLSEKDICHIESCAALHMKGHRAPIIVELPQFADESLWRSVICELSRNGADLSRVIFSGSAFSIVRLPILKMVLDETPAILCLDSFGNVDQSQQNTFSSSSPPSSCSSSSSPLSNVSPIPPNDDEIVEVLTRLLQPDNAFAEAKLDVSSEYAFRYRIILTPCLRSKLHMRKYGGPGFKHCFTGFQPRLIGAGFSIDLLHDLSYGNAARLLAWCTPPRVEERAPDLLRCYICVRDFPAEEQYSKFGFVYCSSACLGKHKKMDWKLNE